MSLHSEYDPAVPGLTLGLSVEPGRTCHELPAFPNETEFGGTIGADGGLDAGSLTVSPSGITAGRGALPPGVAPGSDPGSPCDGSVSL